MGTKTEYLRQYRLAHLEDYKRRSKEWAERQKLGIEGDRGFYHTREELQEAEKQGEGSINWDRWDKIVDQTKQQLKELEEQKKTPPIKNNKPRYVFNTIDGKMLFKDTDVNLAAKLAIPLFQVRVYCNAQKYIKYKNLLFANEFIPTWHVKAIINQYETKKTSLCL